MGGKILGIYGAGGLGREVLELSRIINEKNHQWESFVFIVDGDAKGSANGVPILKYEDALETYGESLDVTVAIGEPAIREQKFAQLKKGGVHTPTLVHPDVHIPDSTKIGTGVTIQYGCFISCNVTIEDGVFLQPQCNIGHDDILREGCMVSGICNLGGAVTIGRHSYVGISAVIKQGLSIGEYAIIGMGTIVNSDVMDGVIALGNPARVIARNTDRRVFR